MLMCLLRGWSSCCSKWMFVLLACSATRVCSDVLLTAEMLSQQPFSQS